MQMYGSIVSGRSSLRILHICIISVFNKFSEISSWLDAAPILSLMLKSQHTLHAHMEFSAFNAAFNVVFNSVYTINVVFNAV